MSLVNTRLLAARAAYPTLLDRDQLRKDQFGLIDVAVRANSNPNSIISAQVRQMLKDNWKSANMQIPVMNRATYTVTDGRSCNFSDLEANSALVTPTYITKTTGFSMVPAANMDNTIAYEQEFRRLYEDAERALAIQVEQAIYAALNTNKSAVFGSPLVGAGLDYPLAGDALQVSTALRTEFFNQYQAIANADEFYGNFDVIGTPVLKADVNKFINQGAGNNENQAYQFAGYNFSYSNYVTTTASARSTGFIMPAGSIALESRLSPEEKAGMETTTGVEWDNVTSELMPGLQIGVKYKSDCHDAYDGGSGRSGVAGDTSSLKEQWTLTVDFCILTPYNLNGATLAGSIHKFDIL